ncbi:uncharacterized protein YcbK (DUF882 family) [Azospirillum fermentarium]|uniref:YcbK family protein n=1 Tax=Azospirillum fermentarium TaxID=1233114 RepID=UPI00222776E1|nr:DUF882 domain-containing protein [Azospirillum fermentarium]MCW2244994.1 uncharacterized protein YcbK (DUF882 family) [Azospirillum fermentarium]
MVRASAWALLLGCGVSGCASGPSVMDGGPRFIAISHYGSGERVAGTYWHDGRYDADVMGRLAGLFRDRRSGEETAVDPALIDYLVAVRRTLGAPDDTEIKLTSGYRSPSTNATLARTNANVADNSYHIRGQAADFMIAGYSARQVGDAAKNLRLGGYAAYPHTGHVHVDTGPYRTWAVKVPPGFRAPDEDAPIVEARAPSPPRTTPPAVARIPSPPAAAAPVVRVSAPVKKKPDTVDGLSPEDMANVRFVLMQMNGGKAPK